MIDVDNSGQITLEELKNGLERVGSDLKDSEITSLMQAADVDNNGTIDYKEFVAAMLHLNKVCEKFGVGDVQLEEFIREVDQDNDGQIDYSEFVAMMQDIGFGIKGLSKS
ncbi:calcium-dependent kinase 20-like [Olea europaea subsp. europaea]|uniref:Calcium-dependent kinase 20-like n=1 Tax=Olea europaea subsp. europaea TaxID=158383 RepID=A0A8S0TDB2_OLEEU|nr:calcium-dependent kinase 20-like [Olea europaea subsp. europaea]